MQCQPQRTQGHKRQDFNKTKRGGEWKETRNRTARQKRKKTQNTKHSPTDTHHYRQLLATHGIWRYPTYIRGSIHNGFRNILLAGALPYGVKPAHCFGQQSWQVMPVPSSPPPYRIKKNEARKRWKMQRTPPNRCRGITQTRFRMHLLEG